MINSLFSLRLPRLLQDFVGHGHLHRLFDFFERDEGVVLAVHAESVHCEVLH
jgi:hypothetical protein